MGKGGGALSAWIKEFVTLVFVQTIQAFIFAIIITIILFGMVRANGDISADDNNAALGLMATFALLSVFKVEEMAKKIFGISDTKASHKNAMRSIAKTAIAAKLGGRVLNNAGKFLGGMRAWGQAGQDRRKAKQRLEEDMADNGFKMENGKVVPTGSGRRMAGNATTNSSLNNSGRTGNNAPSASEGEATVGSQGYSQQYENEMSAAAYRRVKNALRAYEDKANEINKARNEGIKNMISSVSESTGAVIGGTAGGILGGADGNIDEALQGILAGAGTGDIVGKNTVEAIDKATQMVSRMAKRKPGVSDKELRRAIEGYKDALNKANVNHSGKINMNDLDI